MRDRGISGYVDEVPNRRPHLTLADYSNLDEAEFMDMFDRFYNARAGFSLNFGMLGTFIGSGTLFLAPNPAAELLKFHAEHHQYFSRYADEAVDMILHVGRRQARFYENKRQKAGKTS